MAEQVRTTPGISVALTIAGSDSGGGAGIEADLKTFAVMGVFGAVAITAITAQNTRGVRAAHVLDPSWIEEQIDAVAGDLEVAATKVGMVGNAANVKIIARAIERHNLYPLVVDPVMVAKGGDSLIDDAAVSALCTKLMPLAAVVTPNRREAARLLGRGEAIADVFAAGEAAKGICRKFALRACIVKGIRRPNDQEGQAVDVLYDGRTLHEIVSDWRPTENTHGSGCTFSAAITAGLASGLELEPAVRQAKNVVSEAIRQTTGLGSGISPVNHLAYLAVKK